MSHLEREGDDPLDLLHRVAATNMTNIPYALKDAKVYGKFRVLPVPAERRERLEQALNRVEEVVRPTILSANRRHTVAEVQDKLYRHILPMTLKFKECMMKSRNIGDVNFCSDRLENQLSGDAVEYAKTIIRDF